MFGFDNTAEPTYKFNTSKGVFNDNKKDYMCMETCINGVADGIYMLCHCVQVLQRLKREGMKKSRIIGSLVAIAIACVLCGCGSKNSSQSGEKSFPGTRRSTSPDSSGVLPRASTAQR